MEGLKIITYNSTGLGETKQAFIRGLLNEFKPGVIFLQETWLLNSNLALLGNLNSDYLYTGTSGVPDGHLLVGRPFGGVAILWRKELAKCVDIVRDIKNCRICAVEVHAKTQSLLLVNVYLPIDNRRKAHLGDELLDCMDAIDQLIQRFPNHGVIVGGDVNADFRRNNAHDRYLKNFCDYNMLCDIWSLPEIPELDTYIDLSNDSSSCIDRFMVSQSLAKTIQQCIVHHSSENMSNHQPVILNISTSIGKVNVKNHKRNMSDRIAWHKVHASPDLTLQYKTSLNNLLSQVTLPDVSTCKDLRCSSVSHKHQLNEWCIVIVRSCMEAAKDLPSLSHRQEKCTPGWTEHVKSFQDDNRWWHRLWVQAGRPKDGAVYNYMKQARNQYMYAVRRVKRNERNIRYQKMAIAAASDNSRDFFTEIKKLRPKKITVPNINGETADCDIAELFAAKYRTLFQQHSTDLNQIEDVNQYIDEKLDYGTCVEQNTSPNDVLTAIQKLKQDKSDGDLGFNSSHLILGGAALHEQLSHLFQAMLWHGHTPECLLLGTMSSIPKDLRGNLCTDTNYRGITLCNSIGKVLDYIILQRNARNLQSSSAQFAYKQGSGTAMCTLMTKEIIRHYMDNGSYVYCCALDMSKAFDLVRHDCLFRLLINRDVPAMDLRILKDSYCRQHLRVVWNSKYSETFRCSNGIRQGAVASPQLFCVYVDELIERLKKQRSGCWIGPYYYGVICYADDILLLSPSIAGLRHMTDTCSKFASEFGMNFNCEKSMCIRFGSRPCVDSPIIKINSQEIKWVNRIKHLGNIISYNLSEEDDVSLKRRDLFTRVNTMLAVTPNAPEQVLMKIFSSKCCHFYGLQAWCLTDKYVEQFFTAWNRSVRHILQLHPSTHTGLLPYLTGWDVRTRVMNSCMKLVRSVQEHSDLLVKFIGTLCTENANQCLAKNIRYIQLHTSTNVENSCVTKTHANMLKELRDCVKGEMHIENFTVDEIKDIISSICIY